jgi:CBS domain-containing protein
MKAQELMTSLPLTCGPQSNLAEVAQLMWKGDCGIVPITDDSGKLLGVITDRDICIAAATQDRAPSSIRTAEMPHGDVFACRPEDDAQIALTLMRERRVRRVPVTTNDGTLVGILSINDLALMAEDRGELTTADVLNAMKSICAHRASVQTATAAAPAPAPAPAVKKAGAGA